LIGYDSAQWEAMKQWWLQNYLAENHSKLLFIDYKEIKYKYGYL
jgi:hypothetical protein